MCCGTTGLLCSTTLDERLVAPAEGQLGCTGSSGRTAVRGMPISPPAVSSASAAITAAANLVAGVVRTLVITAARCC